jgi:hypothetical protein
LANDVACFKSGGSKSQALTLSLVPRHEARMYDF